MAVNFHGLGLGNRFVNMTSKTQATKRSKEKMGENFVNHVSDKGLISRIYIEFS